MTNKILTAVILSLLFSCKNKDENACDNMTSENVCVIIINQSGHNTKILTLKDEQGIKDIGPLTNNSKTSLMYKSAGENSYIITAILDNGDTIKSKGNYTEGGYSMTEIITKDSIKTKYNNSY